MTPRAIGFVVLLCLFYIWRGHAYATVWQSDATLWNYAVRQTPLFDLPVLNAAIVNHP